MARPLQKKKNRSSLPRVCQKSKSKRINIKSNPIVAANWDNSLTLTQNYRRLGLSSKLNSSTGGTEPKTSAPNDNDPVPGSASRTSTQDDPLSIRGAQSTSKGLGTVKVVRDGEGNITGIIRDGAKENPLNDPLNDLSDSEEMQGKRTSMANRGIVAELEESTRVVKRKKPRKQNQREMEWIERLVERWGEDVEGMSRDRKLNPMQYSARELRRRVKIWRESRRSSADDMDVG